jgi:monoamine oxidase
MKLLETLQQSLGLVMAGGSLGRPSVCVVGAGFAGLRAASVLIEKGWDVTVLEARDRVGGRVVTSTLFRTRIS